MQLGMIGLGRMGMNMARRLVEAGHDVTGYSVNPAEVEKAASYGIRGSGSLKELVRSLEPPRTCWIMVPAGRPVDQTVDGLAGLLDAGDTVVDGGNSFYKDAGPRAERLAARGVAFLDVGVSGGIWGRTEGYCQMIGGPRPAFERLEPIFAALAPEGGYLYCGPTGAGHFVKMVHNGIEYGLMAAYGEGFEILAASPFGADLDLAAVADLWNRGSVVRSWLLELTARALRRDPGLSEIAGYVEDSGEGRWTVQQAVAAGVAAPVIALALFQRFRSRQEDTFADRVIAAMRREFGGHAVHRRGERPQGRHAGAGEVEAARPDRMPEEL